MKLFDVCATIAGTSKQYNIKLTVQALDQKAAVHTVLQELVEQGFEVVNVAVLNDKNY